MIVKQIMYKNIYKDKKSIETSSSLCQIYTPKALMQGVEHNSK